MASWSDILSMIVGVIKTFSISDLLDIILVSYLVYKGIVMIRETRAEQLLKGLLIFTAAYLLVSLFDLKTMSFILTNILQIGILALIILFQPELRRILEKTGRSRVTNWGFFSSRDKSGGSWDSAIHAIGEAARDLSASRTGAIMVLERTTKLSDLVSNAVYVDAETTPQLLCNLFYPNSPLHDGAVILRDGRVLAAGCFLPSTQQVSLDKQLGSRHRAAIGMSENSDALIVTISEETGIISVAEEGNLIRGFTPQTLEDFLCDKILPKTSKKKKRVLYRKGGGQA